MSATEVILHVAPCDPGTQAYLLTLHIPGEAPLNGSLPAAALAGGAWTPDTLLARIADRAVGTDLMEAGRTVFQWLFPPPLAARWRELATPRPPRLLLRLEAPELAPIPWELACDGKPGNPVWLGVLGLVRAHAAPAAPDPSAPWPLRFLVVVGCSEVEEPALEVGTEVANLERTFLPWGRSIDLQILRRPRASELQGWIASFRPHVFHFAGHAGRHPDTDQPGLLISHPDGTWILDVAALPTLILDHGWYPRFVFLNACRTAAESREAASIQHAFLANGIPAVLAMQADVRGSLAGVFAAALYGAAAMGGCIRDAMRLARRALLTEGLANQHLGPEWVLPSLTLAHPESSPVPCPILVAPPRPALETYERCLEFEEARFFADCREQRRAIIQWVHPVIPTEEPAEAPLPALLLHGVRRCGKSHLAKWCLESLARPGEQVRYVAHHPPGVTTFLDVLRQVRDGEPRYRPNVPPTALELLHSPLPARHFHLCNHQVNHILQHGRMPDDTTTPEEGEAVPDAMLPLRPVGEHVLPLLCGAFRQGLESVVREAPLLLVLDLFTDPEGNRQLTPTDVDLLLRRVFLPLLRTPGLHARFRLMVVANTEDLGHFRLQDLLKPDAARVELRHDQPHEELTRCVHEMFHYRNPELYTPIADHVVRMATDRQGLARLKAVRDLVDALPPWKEHLWVDRMR